MQIERIETGRRLSEVVVHDGRAYLTGQTADDVSQDITGQTREVLASIDRLLGRVGTDKTRILVATIWLTRREDFDPMNKVWEAWIPPGEAPARATVCSALMGSDATLVEIAVQAAV